MKSEASVEIDRPIEQVFELTNENVSKWSTVVVEDEVIEDRNNGDVGTKFRIVMFFRGRFMQKSSCLAAQNELRSLKEFVESHP